LSDSRVGIFGVEVEFMSEFEDIGPFVLSNGVWGGVSEDGLELLIIHNVELRGDVSCSAVEYAVDRMVVGHGMSHVDANA